MKKVFLHCGSMLAAFFLLAVSSGAAQTYSQSGGTATRTGQTFSSSSADTSVITVSSSGTLTLDSCTVTKSGNTSSSGNSSSSGLNAAILAKGSSKITIIGGTITTTGTGANAVYSNASTISVTGTVITCSAQYAHGVDAVSSGVLTVDSATITTSGANGSGIATDGGGGIVTVTNTTAKVSGNSSAGVYVDGQSTITVTNSTLSSTKDNGVVLTGNGVLYLNSCAVSGIHALMKHSPQSASEIGTATLSGGTLTATQGAAIYDTAAVLVITLKDGATISVTTNADLVRAVASSTVTFTADGETLEGGISADSTSTISTTLQNNTTLTGSVNSANTASSTTLTLDASSNWILTADSYLTSIANSAGISGTTVTNITGNGHNVYYNSSKSVNTYLGGLTYSLLGGGYLLPTGSTGIDAQSTTAAEFSLCQNYPNPFNPSTSIVFELPQQSRMTLKVYNVVGQEVAVLYDGLAAAGRHEVFFNAIGLASGVYFYCLTTEGNAQTRKMILQK